LKELEFHKDERVRTRAKDLRKRIEVGPPEGIALGNKGRIEGTKWTSEETDVNGLTLPAGRLKLEFGKDYELVCRDAPLTVSGTYSLDSDDQVTFHLDRALAGRREHTETIVIQGDRLTMTDADGTSITFVRMK